MLTSLISNSDVSLRLFSEPLVRYKGRVLRSVRTERSEQGVQDFCVPLLVILSMQECLYCQAHQGMPLNSTHTLMSRGCPEQAGTGTPFPKLRFPHGMRTVPDWKRGSCPPAIIHLQPLFNTAAPVLLHPRDASKASVCGLRTSADPNNAGRSRSWSVAHSWARQRRCSERASPKEGNLATHQHFNEGSDIH